MNVVRAKGFLSFADDILLRHTYIFHWSGRRRYDCRIQDPSTHAYGGVDLVLIGPGLDKEAIVDALEKLTEGEGRNEDARE